MPRTIEEGFRDFLKKLTPSSGESEAAKKHRASIEACLRNNFDIMRFFRSGSFGNGTSISGFSDVDYFASVPRHHLTNNSANTLRKVRDALDIRYPFTGVHVDCPAVVAPFGTSITETTEIVPADYVDDHNSFRIYEIPDCRGGWIRSSPDAHDAYVRYHDERLGGKLKPLIRFIKAWKFIRNVPISSFYLELRTTKYASEENTIVYSIDVERVLSHIWDNQLARLQDPMGISGYIEPCLTDVQFEDAKSTLLTAVVRAEKARQAETELDYNNAFYWWDLLYDANFPSYYY